MKRIFGLILILILYNCTENVEKPNNLVSEEKMAEVLSEIYKRQSSSYMNEAAVKPLDYARVNAYLLKENGIKAEDFEKSYEYYVLNPDLYESILKLTHARLENQLPEKEKIKRNNLQKEEDEASEN